MSGMHAGSPAGGGDLPGRRRCRGRRPTRTPLLPRHRAAGAQACALTRLDSRRRRARRTRAFGAGFRGLRAHGVRHVAGVRPTRWSTCLGRRRSTTPTRSRGWTCPAGLDLAIHHGGSGGSRHITDSPRPAGLERHRRHGTASTAAAWVAELHRPPADPPEVCHPAPPRRLPSHDVCRGARPARVSDSPIRRSTFAYPVVYPAHTGCLSNTFGDTTGYTTRYGTRKWDPAHAQKAAEERLLAAPPSTSWAHVASLSTGPHGRVDTAMTPRADAGRIGLAARTECPRRPTVRLGHAEAAERRGHTDRPDPLAGRPSWRPVRPGVVLLADPLPPSISATSPPAQRRAAVLAGRSHGCVVSASCRRPGRVTSSGRPRSNPEMPSGSPFRRTYLLDERSDPATERCGSPAVPGGRRRRGDPPRRAVRGLVIDVVRSRLVRLDDVTHWVEARETERTTAAPRHRAGGGRRRVVGAGGGPCGPGPDARRCPTPMLNPELKDRKGQRLTTPDLWVDDVGMAMMVHSRAFHAGTLQWDATVTDDWGASRYRVVVSASHRNNWPRTRDGPAADRGPLRHGPRVGFPARRGRHPACRIPPPRVTSLAPKSYTQSCDLGARLEPVERPLVLGDDDREERLARAGSPCAGAGGSGRRRCTGSGGRRRCSPGRRAGRRSRCRPT